MRTRNGFVLIAALWLIVAISTAGLHIATRSRAQRLALANALEKGRARAAAEAGLDHVRSRLMAVLEDGTRSAWGPALLRASDAAGRLGQLLDDTIALGAARYTVRLVDTGALLHLDRADEEQLRRFLRALRVDWSEADRIAQAIADFRDPDDLHRARGAERAHYLEEGLPALPRNAPFEDVAELAFVMAVTPATYSAARPYLTLDGPGLVNVNTAAEPVLRSLPGMTAAAADVVLRRRTMGRPVRTMQELSDALPPIARQAFLHEMPEFLRRATFDPVELLVVSEGWVDGSPLRVRLTAQIVPAGATVLVPWRRFE